MPRNPPAGITLRPLPGGKQAGQDAVIAESAENWRAIVIEWLPRNGRRRAAGELELTPRQLEVLSLLALGYDTSPVANHLGCARTTARNHSHWLLVRFGARGRIVMPEQARRLGMIA